MIGDPIVSATQYEQSSGWEWRYAFPDGELGMTTTRAVEQLGRRHGVDPIDAHRILANARRQARGAKETQ